MARYRRRRRANWKLRLFLLLLFTVAATAGIVWLVSGLFSDRGEEPAAPENQLPPGQGEEAPPSQEIDEDSGEPAEADPEPEAEAQPEVRPIAGNTDDSWRLILVSASNPIGVDFSPPALEYISGDHRVDARIAPNLRQMIAEARLEGITLMVTSAYRPAERQAVLHNQQIERFIGLGQSEEEAIATASSIVLPPGTSEHQTGLAVDIVTPEYQVLDEGFADTPAGRWLAENSWRYGFILRYPRDKQEITRVIFEPWHFRYVGEEHARIIFEGGYTLEEYLYGVLGR